MSGSASWAVHWSAVLPRQSVGDWAKTTPGNVAPSRQRIAVSRIRGLLLLEVGIFGSWLAPAGRLAGVAGREFHHGSSLKSNSGGAASNSSSCSKMTGLDCDAGGFHSCRARLTSAADWKRLSGSLAIIRSQILTSSGGAPGRWSRMLRCWPV